MSSILSVLILICTLFTVKAVDLQVDCIEGEACLLPCWTIQGDQEDPDVEWLKSPSDGKAVHFNGDGHDKTDTQDPAFKGRTALDREEMKKGNMSLTLRDVKKSDERRYTCVLYPGPLQRANVQLKVFPNNQSIHLTDDYYVQVSTPEVLIRGHGRDGGVVLQCQSGGWPLEPQLKWRDSKGRLLSAEVIQTEPEGHYTVWSVVTVQKTGTNRFTCQVQLQNHTRDTTIYVPDEIFPVTSYALCIVAGHLVGGAILCLFIGIFLGGLMMWMKYRKLISGRNGHIPRIMEVL